VRIPLKFFNSELDLNIESENSIGKIVYISEAEAEENGEARCQIFEGHYYEYSIQKGFFFEEIAGVVSRSKIDMNRGRISPGNYVGTLTIGVISEFELQKVGELRIEVQSIKSSYREDYRVMLEEITERSTDLLLQPNSPVSQNLTIDFNAPAKIIYQRFAFIKSILKSSEFADSVNKFLFAPLTKWEDKEEEFDIRKVRRLTNKSIKQFASSANRETLPPSHSLSGFLQSVPRKISISQKHESVDTVENRFIKFALESFTVFCAEVIEKAKGERLQKEAIQLSDTLEHYLGHSVFKEISVPNFIPINSPILQRKEGYREIFRSWLMFDLAAKLIWHGGEDVYAGNKRNVAVLYEYWLFFKLLDLIKEIFQIESKELEQLLEQTDDGLSIRLKQGQYLPIKGVSKIGGRSLNVEFSYNKTFHGDSHYPNGGSWTESLRPDYTLSIWPVGIEYKEADEAELIVHIHFDAKYRIENLLQVFGTEEIQGLEESSKINYKKVDLLKMHTYKDAIRRTAGAYILYPGKQSKQINGFHEILPGLGAFAIRPSKFDSGIQELREFLNQVLIHFVNRTSQREKMNLKAYQVYRQFGSSPILQSLPEPIGLNRAFIPDEVFVLVGYYKNEEHLEWILKNKIYNTRAGTRRGSLRLTIKEVSATYLLLYTSGQSSTNKLFKLNGKGPLLVSKEELIKRAYPRPGGEFYFVFDITSVAESEFENIEWDYKKLLDSHPNIKAAEPFGISISELMDMRIQ
jgi:predicted component of viral defense system (DUF524 family)